MSGKRYTDEFKIEAVRQVTDRGYPVSEVAERLGVTAHSLYAWLKKFSPNQAKDQELDEAQRNMHRHLARLDECPGPHTRRHPGRDQSSSELRLPAFRWITPVMSAGRSGGA